MAPVLSDAASLNRWRYASSSDPYDRNAHERLGEIVFRVYGDDQPFGTIERSHMLLQLIGGTFPIPEMTEAYFANLERLLEQRRPLPRPGQLALGLGPGRCGSTTLAGLVAMIDGSCCTHENRPIVDWQPHEEQVQFHLRRFALLMRYFPLVFDAAHWWVNIADRIIEHFPETKLIGLTRDREACAHSFLALKGPYNHWSLPRGPWKPNRWDPAYPSYALPDCIENDPDEAKHHLVLAYITEYEDRLAALAERHPDKYLPLRTEMLSDPSAQQSLFRHLGQADTPVAAVRLNVKGMADGSAARFSF